jgi:hypothetical protein
LELVTGGLPEIINSSLCQVFGKNGAKGQVPE